MTVLFRSHDGKISLSINLMLAFIASVAGETAASKIQLSAKYYPSSVKYSGFENHAEAPAYIKTSY